MRNDKTIALVGNPNCGKTSLFNVLTGSNQHVGNWPGVTIEKKHGFMLFKGEKISAIDLPGIYSLDTMSEDEVVTKNYIVNEKPDIVVNVVDATNLERSLYLTLQLLEINVRCILVLNMMDEVEVKDIKIDSSKLAQLLELEVVSIAARKSQGIEELKQTIADEINKNIETSMTNSEFDNNQKEEDDVTVYKTISDIVEQCVKIPEKKIVSVTSQIDKVVLNKYLAMPLFFIVMFMIFEFTFIFSEPFVKIIESIFEFVGVNVSNWLTMLGSSSLVKSFIIDGVIAGIGSVITFFPSILLLFFFIALLEASGYMSRAAYITDRFMASIGLEGKAFISLLLGFGCNVPAIMSARTLQSKKDRLITILINPFMSCSARLPVYILFANAFFRNSKGLVVFSLYILGIVIAVISAKLFNRFLFSSEKSMFLMELPPYRLPHMRSIMLDMWQRASQFLKKAGTIIFGMVVIIWVLSSLPIGVGYASSQSIIGRVGSIIAPIFIPAGFGNWQAAVALIFGVMAKEVVVSTLGVVYGVGESGILKELPKYFTTLSAYSFMIMTLLYIPCASTIGAIRKETNSWKWSMFSIVYSFTVGWIMAVLVYQIGSILGFK